MLTVIVSDAKGGCEGGMEALWVGLEVLLMEYKLALIAFGMWGKECMWRFLQGNYESISVNHTNGFQISSGRKLTTHLSPKEPTLLSERHNSNMHRFHWRKHGFTGSYYLHCILSAFESRPFTFHLNPI